MKLHDKPIDLSDVLCLGIMALLLHLIFGREPDLCSVLFGFYGGKWGSHWAASFLERKQQKAPPG